MSREMDERLLQFLLFVRSGCHAGVWAYSEKGEVYYTSCDHAKELEHIFALSGCLKYALEEGKKLKRPFIMSDATNLVWLGDFADRGEKGEMLVVVGPVYFQHVQVQEIQSALRKKNLSVATTRAYERILLEIPIVSIDMLKQYGRMLHCAITGMEVKSVEFQMQEEKNEVTSGINIEQKEKEQEDLELQIRQNAVHTLLQCIKDGNRNYKTHYGARDFYYISEIPSELEISNTQALCMISIMISRCSEAAIQGGVPLIEAKNLERAYIKEAQKKKTITEFIQLNQEMIDSFVDLVCSYKANYGVSRPIAECCEYIREHLTEDLDLKKLALITGYTEYYLTRKFKNEMGVRLLDYIKEKRIEYAKMWLVTTDYSIEEISSALHFTERSHFSRVFKEFTGISPAHYREKVKGTLMGGHEI